MYVFFFSFQTAPPVQTINMMCITELPQWKLGFVPFVLSSAAIVTTNWQLWWVRFFFLFLNFLQYLFNFFFLFFSGSDVNEVSLFIRRPNERRFDFVLFNPFRTIINIGYLFMYTLSRSALNTSRGYRGSTNRNNPMWQTWLEVFNFLQDSQRCPFNRNDLRHYNTTARRYR